MEDLTGRIVWVPQGTPMTREEDPGEQDGVRRRSIKRTRKGQFVAVVEDDGDRNDHDHQEPCVGYETVGGYRRWVPRRCVASTPDERQHRLSVGRRQITGGSPIRGGGNHYTTRGSCACGMRLGGNGTTAVDVRRDWFDHIATVAKYGEFRLEFMYDDGDTYEDEKPIAWPWDVVAARGPFAPHEDVYARLAALDVGEAVELASEVTRYRRLRVTRTVAAAEVPVHA
jgi:hypothetical protein